MNNNFHYLFKFILIGETSLNPLTIKKYLKIKKKMLENQQFFFSLFISDFKMNMMQQLELNSDPS